MQIEELMRRIGLSDGAQQAVRDTKILPGEYEEWKRIFKEDFKEFLERWKQRSDRSRWALRFYLQMACEVYDEYKEKKIGDEVFNQTFSDIAIWCDDCCYRQGVYGLEEVWWVAQSIKMKLFRLGRLQFEPIVLDEALQGEDAVLERGEEVLNVHIPAGEPLEYEACLESFRMAETFFGKENQKYICDSWLLSPVLKELLPQDSNIIKFQNMFHICKVYDTFPQAEQRIFGEVKNDKAEYPEETCLQKKAKAYVMKKKKIGIGIGYIENIYKLVQE